MESVNYSQSDTILVSRVEDLANLKALDVSFFTNDSQFYTVFKRPGKQKKRDTYSYVKYNGSVNRLAVVKLYSN